MGPKLNKLYEQITYEWVSHTDIVEGMTEFWVLTARMAPMDNLALLNLLNENPDMLTYVFGQANLNGDADLGWVIWTCVREALMDEMFGTGNWEYHIY